MTHWYKSVIVWYASEIIVLDPSRDITDIIKLVRSPGKTRIPFRPPILKGSCEKSIEDLITLLWEEDPSDRPGLPEILKRLTQMNGGE